VSWRRAMTRVVGWLPPVRSGLDREVAELLAPVLDA
jgi:hypothetical protein